MTQELMWAIVALSALLLILGAGLIGYSIQRTSRVKMRDLLHSERMAAMKKGISLPESDSEAAWKSSASLRFTHMPALKIISLCGVVLLFGGIGLIVGFRNSSYQILKELESLGYIPGFMGLGLTLYSVVLRFISSEANKIKKLP
jgi:FtsH-binding integral membrane protein